MTYFRPCFNCAIPRKECDTAKRMTAGLRGLGVTSVKFNCPDRKPKFAPGQRVSVTWTVFPPDYEFGDDYADEAWPATVSCESGNKFVIRVDDVPSDFETPAREYIKSANLYCKVSASKLKPLDEPAQPICKRCGEIGGLGFIGCYDLNGEGKFLMGPHPDCALGQERAALHPNGD